MMSKFTTIQISVDVKKKLEKLKASNRETYNEVIENLIEDTLKLSEEAQRDLEEALDDVKNDRLITHENIKQMFGL